MGARIGMFCGSLFDINGNSRFSETTMACVILFSPSSYQKFFHLSLPFEWTTKSYGTSMRVS
jgi:hypothetical protein